MLSRAFHGLQGVSAGLLILLAPFPGQASTTIRYQYNWYASPDQNEAFEALIDAFNRTHADVKVEGFVVQGTYDKLLAAVAAGVAADVVHFESSAVVEWAARGLLEPLDDLYTPDRLTREFLPADAAEVIWNGHVWGIPGYTNVRGLYWNVDIFNEVGLDSSWAPRTVAELETLARKALKTDSEGGIDRVGFLPWLGSFTSAGWFWAFGGDVYDWVRGVPTLDKEENVRAWEWVQDWARRYPLGKLNLVALQGTSSAYGYFLGGSFAAVTGADNFVSTIRRFFPDLNFRTGEVPHPGGGRNGTWGGGIGHVIPRGARHLPEAELFLRWLAEDGQRILYERLAQFPTRRAVGDRVRRSLSPDDRRLPLFAQMAVRNPRPPLWANVLGKLITAENAEIIPLKSNPRDVLHNLQREVAPLYAPLVED